MKPLPNDVSRCCGRLDGKVCPEREGGVADLEKAQHYLAKLIEVAKAEA